MFTPGRVVAGQPPPWFNITNLIQHLVREVAVPRQTEVGVVGLGVMGSAITRRLLAAGHVVRVHDIRPAAMEKLSAAGARLADTPGGAAGGGVVLLSLNTAAIVEHVAFGPDGVLATSPQG